MLLRTLQRLVRLAPGPARWAWARVPSPLRRRVAPFIHPIAAGKRGGTLVFPVPEATEAARYDVLVRASHERDPVVTSLAARGHRVVQVATGEAVADAARRAGVLDGVWLTDGPPAPPGLGLRMAPLDRLAGPDDVDAAFPKVTIVVVTWNNRALCEACLSGIRRNTPFPGLEVIAVDNGSGDDTRAMLERRAAAEPGLRLILNPDNRGFARGMNQGLRAARGDLVVILNDDTVPGPGWLSRLVWHLEADPALGLVCPVTNEIGNEARVPVTYDSLDSMEAFARQRAEAHAGQRRSTETIALFCAAGPRALLERVGFIDERYQVGMFEDDDLSLALRRTGARLAIADDAFVHHVGQASFSRLSDAEYLSVWEANRRRFEEKWGARYSPPEPAGS